MEGSIQNSRMKWYVTKDKPFLKEGGCSGYLNVFADVNFVENVALYSTFAFFGFFSGPVINFLGVRITLAIGGVGYSVYTASLLTSVIHPNSSSVYGFNIFGGAFLGFCAALLWTAQGTIMVSYPHENQKGHYFAWFWAIFNLGAVLGSLVGYSL